MMAWGEKGGQALMILDLAARLSKCWTKRCAKLHAMSALSH